MNFMNRLDSTTRAQIVNCLIEGCSIRSTVRMTGAAKKTVMRALIEVGEEAAVALLFCVQLHQDSL